MRYRGSRPIGFQTVVVGIVTWSLALMVLAQDAAKPASTNKPPKAAAKPAATPPAAKPPVAVPAAPAAPADSKSKADPRLVKALKTAGYKHEELDDGVLRLYFEMGDGRSQQVFIASKTQKTGLMETRKLWATAMKDEYPPKPQVANKLLMDTDKVAFGAWELVKWPDGYRILFVASIPVDLPADSLKSAIRLVFSKADAMEKELTDADRF